MVAPGLLVILSPIIFGFAFGPRGVCGLLAGAIVSGVQVGISMSNTGGAWDNAKKYIEHGNLIVNGMKMGKRSEPHKNAVIGDTVGDPMKDTSGPSINILMKLMAIVSLVFGKSFSTKGGLLLPYLDFGSVSRNEETMASLVSLHADGVSQHEEGVSQHAEGVSLHVAG